MLLFHPYATSGFSFVKASVCEDEYVARSLPVAAVPLRQLPRADVHQPLGTWYWRQTPLQLHDQQGDRWHGGNRLRARLWLSYAGICFLINRLQLLRLLCAITRVFSVLNLMLLICRRCGAK